MSVAARVAWLTDALVAPATEDVSPAGLAQVQSDLVRDLQALGAELPEGERLEMDAFKVLLAHRHPDRCMSSGDTFVASPRLCRRAVGVAAVNRCVRRLSGAPGVAVAEVLAEGLEDAAVATGTGAVRAPWWAEWYAGLPSGGRAVVRAEAITWATQLLSAVDWPRISKPVIGGRQDRWQCPGAAPVVLKGRAEVRSLVGRRPALLVVATGRCQADWRVELGYPGLVAALGRDAQAVPCRVVGVWPQSGQVRVLHLDTAALRATASAVVAAVATWVDSRIEVERAAFGQGPGSEPVAVDGVPA
ncbi:MAG: hypothetical protein ABSC30_09005 [Acidimicrobiales bacterium]|jgi:hypothetical protein